MRKIIISLATLGLVACGGGDGDSGDSGGDGGDSGSNESCQTFDDSITDAPQTYDEVADNTWDPIPFDDQSCPVLDPQGDLCEFVGQVIDFQEDEFLPSGVLAGTTVKVFPANVIDDISVTCDDPSVTTAVTCFEAVADSAGVVSFPNLLCDTPFAVWANKIASFAPPTKAAVQFDHIVTRAKDGVPQDVLTISQSTYSLIPGIVGFNPDPTLGIVAGSTNDCNDKGVRYLSTHIVSDHVQTAPDDFCGDSVINRVGTFYFQDNFPTADQTVTSEDGIWAFVNVPPGPVTVFAYKNENGTKAQLGRVELVSLPDTITIADLFLTGL